MTNEALIVSGVRTPIGSLGGVLSTVPATELGATCIKAALEKAGVPGDEVNEVIMGNVVGAGLGQNPARQAAIKAGLAGVGRRHDGQQGVRLGTEGRDAGHTVDPARLHRTWSSPAAWRT